MSGWSTITFEEDYEHIRDMDGVETLDGIRSRVKVVAQEEDVHVTFATYHRNPVLMVGGYRDWSEDRDILEDVFPLWKSAVVIQANDTGDVGHAKYYKKAEDSWRTDKDFKCIDEFKERELAHGRPVGAKAAAYMTLHHDIPCLSSLRRPRFYSIQHYPTRNREAWGKLKKAFTQYDTVHLSDEKIITRLRDAADTLEESENEFHEPIGGGE